MSVDMLIYQRLKAKLSCLVRIGFDFGKGKFGGEDYLFNLTGLTKLWSESHENFDMALYVGSAKRAQRLHL